MNSFTHTFKISYLVLYIDYLILGFLRSQRQDLSTQPLAFKRSLLLTQTKLDCMFWLYNPCKEICETAQALSQGFEPIACWKEIEHPGPISVLNTVPLTCTRWMVHINEGPIFLLPTSASPRDSQGELVQGKIQVRWVWHVKPEKVMKHSLGPLKGFLTKKCKSSSVQ